MHEFQRGRLIKYPIENESSISCLGYIILKRHVRLKLSHIRTSKVQDNVTAQSTHNPISINLIQNSKIGLHSGQRFVIQLKQRPTKQSGIRSWIIFFLIFSTTVKYIWPLFIHFQTESTSIVWYLILRVCIMWSQSLAQTGTVTRHASDFAA